MSVGHEKGELGYDPKLNPILIESMQCVDDAEDRADNSHRNICHGLSVENLPSL